MDKVEFIKKYFPIGAKVITCEGKEEEVVSQNLYDEYEPCFSITYGTDDVWSCCWDGHSNGGSYNYGVSPEFVHALIRAAGDEEVERLKTKIQALEAKLTAVKTLCTPTGDE